MFDLLKNAAQLQEQLKVVGEAIERKTVTGEAGGGLVAATMNGRFELKALRIRMEDFPAKDVEMLEELIVAAVADAHRKAREVVEEEVRRGGLAAPALSSLFGGK